jgi:hypothetical protein
LLCLRLAAVSALNLVDIFGEFLVLLELMPESLLCFYKQRRAKRPFDFPLPVFPYLLEQTTLAKGIKFFGTKIEIIQRRDL